MALALVGSWATSCCAIPPISGSELKDHFWQLLGTICAAQDLIEVDHLKTSIVASLLSDSTLLSFYAMTFS